MNIVWRGARIDMLIREEKLKNNKRLLSALTSLDIYRLFCKDESIRHSLDILFEFLDSEDIYHAE